MCVCDKYSVFISISLGVLAEVREMDSSLLGDCGWKATTRRWGLLAESQTASGPQAFVSPKPIFICSDNTKCHCMLGMFACRMELFSRDIAAG